MPIPKQCFVCQGTKMSMVHLSEQPNIKTRFYDEPIIPEPYLCLTCGNLGYAVLDQADIENIEKISAEKGMIIDNSK